MKSMSQSEIVQYVLEQVNDETRHQLFFSRTNIVLKSKESLEMLLDKIEEVMRDIKIKSVNNSKTKKWKYFLLLGRTTTRWNNNNSSRCVQHPSKHTFMVNASNVLDRPELTKWILNLYQMSRTLLKMFDETWAGKHDDFVVQFTCMNNTSFVLNHHHKNDISSQFAISLGEYEGGLLMVRNEMTNEYIHLNNNRKMVQFDGRKDHLVTKVTEGERYSIVFYKSYDMRYDYQPIFIGIKTYT